MGSAAGSSCAFAAKDATSPPVPIERPSHQTERAVAAERELSHWLGALALELNSSVAVVLCVQTQGEHIAIMSAVAMEPAGGDATDRARSRAELERAIAGLREIAETLEAKAAELL